MQFFGGLVQQRVYRGKSETAVVPALQPLPLRRAERSQREIVRCCKECQQDECSKKARVVCPSEEIVAEWHDMATLAVHVIQPRPTSKMNALSDDSVYQAGKPCPQADISSQIGGQRCASSAQQVIWANPKRCCQKHQSGIRRCKTGTRDPVAVGTSDEEKKDGRDCSHGQRKMVPDQPASQTCPANGVAVLVAHTRIRARQKTEARKGPRS